MVCSDFAVLRGNYTQELYTQEKQRNIYEHIYWTLLTPYSNPPYRKTLRKWHLQTTSASDWQRDKCPDKTTLK